MALMKAVASRDLRWPLPCTLTSQQGTHLEEQLGISLSTSFQTDTLILSLTFKDVVSWMSSQRETAEHQVQAKKLLTITVI